LDPVGLHVNGEHHELTVPAHRTLLEVIREGLGLTGTKHGCELGECGACTVLVDGKAQLSCLTLAIQVAGCEVTTIEGLASGGGLHPLQETFAALGAAQCGYCTPGMILTAAALLDRESDPDPEQIRDALAGNMCRCTGYLKILEAVAMAAPRLADTADAR
jgi:carbon-monoxide dehydrogenase small subunit